MKDYVKLTLMVTLIFQCSERQRLNPIDPQNPHTGGRLVGVSISSKFDQIYLSWNKIQVSGLKGYNVYRKSDGGNSFQQICLVPPDSVGFKDNELAYGPCYSYFVTAVTSTYESAPSETLSISPGPTHIWMTDADDRRIYSISHDGLHIRNTIAVDGYPWDVFILSADRSIWYSDRLYGRIFKIMGEKKISYSPESTYWDPVDMSFDEPRNTLWIADRRGKVIKIITMMQDSVREIIGEQFRQPISVSVNKTNGFCWMADPVARTVFEISADQNQIREVKTDLQRPTCVVGNASDASCWVADSSRILNMFSDGTIAFTIQDYFQNLFTITINENTNALWAFDAGSYSSDSRLIKFSDQGNKIFEIVGFFQYPESIVVNTHDNSCAITDYESGSLTRISSDGNILSRLSGFYFLHGLCIEYRPE